MRNAPINAGWIGKDKCFVRDLFDYQRWRYVDLAYLIFNSIAYKSIFSITQKNKKFVEEINGVQKKILGGIYILITKG